MAVQDPCGFKGFRVRVEALPQLSGRGLSDGVVSELATYWEVLPGHEDELRAATQRFAAVLQQVPLEKNDHTTTRAPQAESSHTDTATAAQACMGSPGKASGSPELEGIDARTGGPNVDSW